MSERVIDLVPGLVRGQKRNGRCVYDKQAKRELVRRCQQPGVSVAALALAHGLNANLLRKWITVAMHRRGRSTSVRADPVAGDDASAGGRQRRRATDSWRWCCRAARSAFAAACRARRCRP